MHLGASLAPLPSRETFACPSAATASASTEAGMEATAGTLRWYRCSGVSCGFARMPAAAEPPRRRVRKRFRVLLLRAPPCLSLKRGNESCYAGVLCSSGS